MYRERIVFMKKRGICATCRRYIPAGSILKRDTAGNKQCASCRRESEGRCAAR